MDCSFWLIRPAPKDSSQECLEITAAARAASAARHTDRLREIDSGATQDTRADNPNTRRFGKLLRGTELIVAEEEDEFKVDLWDVMNR